MAPCFLRHETNGACGLKEKKKQECLVALCRALLIMRSPHRGHHIGSSIGAAILLIMRVAMFANCLGIKALGGGKEGVGGGVRGSCHGQTTGQMTW